VGVQALEPAGTGLAADAAGQLRTEAPLLSVGALGAFTQRRILLRQSAPAPDPARGLEPGDGRHEMATGDVEGRRERLARLVEGCLLRYRWPTERAADGDGPERPRGPADLPLDDCAIIVHHARS